MLFLFQLRGTGTIVFQTERAEDISSCENLKLGQLCDDMLVWRGAERFFTSIEEGTEKHVSFAAAC